MDANILQEADGSADNFDSPRTRPSIERTITNPYSSGSSSDSQRRASVHSVRARLQDGTTYFSIHPNGDNIPYRDEDYTALIYYYTQGLLHSSYHQDAYNASLAHAEEYFDEAWANEAQGMTLPYEHQNAAGSSNIELELVRIYANQNAVYESDFSLGPLDVLYMPLSELNNAVIGVEATSYLTLMISEAPAQEPLLAALGGDPIGLKSHIEAELERWKEHGMRPFFVFDGQSRVGQDEIALRKAKAALTKTQSAWELYAENRPGEAVKAFGEAGAIRVQDLYRILQEVLVEQGLPFQIAPFSACAQLVYLVSRSEPYVDGIMGSNELLLFDTSAEAKIMYPPTVNDWEQKKSFRGNGRAEIIAKLNVTSEILDDALLMSGTFFLPSFPPLHDKAFITQQPFTLVDAINLLRTSEKSVQNTCAAFQDVLDKNDPKWLDKFRKAKMGVNHAIIMQDDGVMVSRDYDGPLGLTSDNNEYLGLQLPSELIHYMSKGLIGYRLGNYFTCLETVVFPTLDGVVSDEYTTLVKRTLIPLKEATTALIASRIHRAYQFKDITVKFWFDERLSHNLVHKSLLSTINSQVDSWKINEPELKAGEATAKTPPGKLSFTFRSLQSKDFVSKTLTRGKELSSKPEILSNILFRLAHVRGYTNDKHELTGWGKALAMTLTTLAPTIEKYNDIQHLEEAAFLAYELIRFDILNSRNRHAELIGGPLRGTDQDKANCILIGRTACLLKLRHQSLGYTGPLSKNFLSFHSLIKAVRETDRDLLEAISVSLCLSGSIARFKGDAQREDWGELGRSLPFSVDVDTSLGIAVKTYLDDFLKLEWSAEEREANKANYVDSFLPYSVNFSEDLDSAFKFFDALYAGVKTLGSEMDESDKKSWESASAYLAKRR